MQVCNDYRKLMKQPLLTYAEEKQLSKRSLAGDQKARDTLVLRNLGLAVTLVNDHRGRGVAEDDLLQFAIMGLMRAARDYDGRCRYGTYASWWIWSYVSVAIRDQASTIRVPGPAGELLAKTLQKNTDYFAEHGVVCDKSQLEQISGLSPGHAKLVSHAIRARYATLSILMEGEEVQAGCCYEDSIYSQHEGPADAVARREEIEQVREAIRGLPDRWRQVMEARLVGETFLAIAGCMGISRQRVQQIETNAKEMLRATLEPVLGDGESTPRRKPHRRGFSETFNSLVSRLDWIV